MSLLFFFDPGGTTAWARIHTDDPFVHNNPPDLHRMVVGTFKASEMTDLEIRSHLCTLFLEKYPDTVGYEEFTPSPLVDRTAERVIEQLKIICPELYIDLVHQPPSARVGGMALAESLLKRKTIHERVALAHAIAYARSNR